MDRADKRISALESFKLAVPVATVSMPTLVSKLLADTGVVFAIPAYIAIFSLAFVAAIYQTKLFQKAIKRQQVVVDIAIDKERDVRNGEHLSSNFREEIKNEAYSAVGKPNKRSVSDVFKLAGFATYSVAVLALATSEPKSRDDESLPKEDFPMEPDLQCPLPPRNNVPYNFTRV